MRYHCLGLNTTQTLQPLSRLLDNDISPYECLTVTLASTNTFQILCKSCFYHIRDLRRIRCHILLSTAKTISNDLISSRLDYCNSLIINIAKQDLSKRQRVQNLHVLDQWHLVSHHHFPCLNSYTGFQLITRYVIKFKLSTLTYRALAIHQPPYLASLLHFSTERPQTTQIIYLTAAFYSQN